MQQRIHSIDAIRGFCLLNIFVNHLGVGYLTNLSPSRIGFCDSAEIFVFLAGISCYLAYGPREGTPVFPARAVRMWARARTLFLFTLVIASASAVICLVGGSFAAPSDPSIFPPELIAKHGIPTYAWHVISMQQSVGLSVVLRLYVCLLLVGPFYVWLASKRYWYPLVPAGLLWLLAGHFEWVERDSLSGVPLALTILPWNLVFAAGLSLGAALTQGIEIRRPRLVTFLALALVVAGPLCYVVATRMSPEVMAWVDARNDFFWFGASKTLQSPLRVCYLFALAYLFIAFQHAPAIRLVHKVSPDNLLCRLGRRSLEVFTFGAVSAAAAEQLLWYLFSKGVVARHSLSALAVELLIVGIAFWGMIRIADRGRARAPRTADAVPKALPTGV